MPGIDSDDGAEDFEGVGDDGGDVVMLD